MSRSGTGPRILDFKQGSRWSWCCWCLDQYLSSKSRYFLSHRGDDRKVHSTARGYKCVNRTRARQVRWRGTNLRKQTNQSKCCTDTPESGCLELSLPWFVPKLLLAIEFETWVNIEPKSMPICFLHVSSNVTGHYKAGVSIPLHT